MVSNVLVVVTQVSVRIIFQRNITHKSFGCVELQMCLCDGSVDRGCSLSPAVLDKQLVWLGASLGER